MLLVRVTSKKGGLLVRMLLVTFAYVFTSKGLLVRQVLFTSKSVVTSNRCLNAPFLLVTFTSEDLRKTLALGKKIYQQHPPWNQRVKKKIFWVVLKKNIKIFLAPWSLGPRLGPLVRGLVPWSL